MFQSFLTAYEKHQKCTSQLLFVKFYFGKKSHGLMEGGLEKFLQVKNKS